MILQTKDRKDILALKDSLTRVRDEIGALKESGEQARQGFVDVALGIKKETTEIKDGLGQVQQGVNQSLFNFDAIGLILSQNIIAGLHEKVSGVVKFIDANQTLSDHKIEGLTGVLTDAVAYIEKVEGLAKDTTVTDTLKAALNDTNKALAQVKNEANQGTRSIADKQAKASIEIKALTKSVTDLADKIAEVAKVAEQKPQIVHVKDADSFSLSNRGMWSPDADGYKRGSIVRHASASWIALANTTEPPSDKATDWALLARDGRGGGSPISGAVNPETLISTDEGNRLVLGEDQKLFVSDTAYKIAIQGKNTTGAAIPKGTAVMATGTLGASGIITIAPMDGTNPANYKYLIGVAGSDIAVDAEGDVVDIGKVRGIDTTAWNEGDVLWISTTTPGALTNVEPVTGLKMPVAFVVTDHANNGEIMVRVTPIDENSFVGEEFETVSKNLVSSDATLNYNAGGDLTSIVYANGITKSLTYNTGGDLTTITLSGSTPSGIDLIKNLSYSTAGDLVGITYE